MFDVHSIEYHKKAHVSEIQYDKIQFIVFATFFVSLIHGVALYSHETIWILITSKLFYLPILYGAITGGLVVGTITGIITSLLHAFIMLYLLPHADFISHLLETISIMIAGLFTGILSDHQRYERKIRKKIELYSRELKKIVETRDKFFSIIAHDLRGPISSQYHFLQQISLDSTQVSKDEFNKYISLLKNSSENVSNLLENLLTWARSQKGDIEFRPAKHHLYFLVQSSLSLFHDQALLKNIKFINTVSPSINAYFDVPMIQTVLRNLIGNAIKFSNENGVISVSATIKDDTIEVSVKDNGIGMNNTTRENLFKVGSNHSRSLGTKGEKGTGLGLIISKEFIERHEGNISVESQKGVGTDFKFYLKIDRP